MTYHANFFKCLYIRCYFTLQDITLHGDISLVHCETFHYTVRCFILNMLYFLLPLIKMVEGVLKRYSTMSTEFRKAMTKRLVI